VQDYIKCNDCGRFGTIDRGQGYCSNCELHNITWAVPGMEQTELLINHWLYQDTTGLDPSKVWVNVYEVTRHYGGPEEGGWWYNWNDAIDSSYVDVKLAQAEVERLTKKHSNREHGDIYSVRGGATIDVSVELTEKASQTTKREQYE
jgi:hypothetical protein